MIERVIIAHDYLEGSAASSRILGFAKGYRDNGMEVFLMLFSPRDTVSLDLKGIEVRVFNEPRMVLRLTRRLIARFRYVKAIKALYIPQKTAIHIYRTPWWGYFFNRKKYNFFFERGEIPFYSSGKSLSYLVQERLGLMVADRATGMLAQTHSLKDFYYLRGVREIEVINMFVDTDRFSGLIPDRSVKYIAYCGTICKHKDGVDDLIRAFGIVHREYPDYKLYLIGGFEKLYGDERYIRNLVSGLGLDDSVVFTGRVGPDRIPALLSGASILALARPVNDQTRYGFPTKLGEYLITGNPVVLTPVGEIGRYLHDGENCIFAPPGDYAAFAQKLLWVISHPAEAKEIGNAGKEVIDDCFSIHSETQKALDFMNGVSNPAI